jgi:putative aldouronate transport system permease protein
MVVRKKLKNENHAAYDPTVRGFDKVVFKAVAYPAVILFALLCLLPFWLIIASSFESETMIVKHGFTMWPRQLSIDSYRIALENPMAILRAYGVTILITIIGTTLGVFFNTMTGYVLSRKDFPWKNGVSYFFFFTTLFNGGLVPWYILVVNYLHMKNTLFALIFPGMISVWHILLVKGFMKGIPFEITESAIIDGAGDFRIFLKFIVPLSKPVIATITLFAALYHWNDWYNCMLFISNTKMYTLQYFLHNLIESARAVREMLTDSQTDVGMIPIESMKMSLTIIVTGPIVFLYPLIQRYFLSGLTIGAVKG